MPRITIKKKGEEEAAEHQHQRKVRAAAVGVARIELEL